MLLLITLIIACTTEREFNSIETSIFNESTSDVEITLYTALDSDLILLDFILIAAGGKYSCTYDSRGFSPDSIAGCYSSGEFPVIFDWRFLSNDTGYICDTLNGDYTFCDDIEGKFDLATARFEFYEIDPEERTVIFTITQEDFENAFELPE